MTLEYLLRNAIATGKNYDVAFWGNETSQHKASLEETQTFLVTCFYALTKVDTSCMRLWRVGLPLLRRRIRSCK